MFDQVKEIIVMLLSGNGIEAGVDVTLGRDCVGVIVARHLGEVVAAMARLMRSPAMVLMGEKFR